MKRLFLICAFLLPCNAILYSQSGWFQLSTGTSRYISDVHFINENTGWCSSDSATILKTTNGGLNWTSLNIYSNQKLNLVFVRFADNMTGFAGGYIYDYSAYLQYRLLFKTTNQGLNWFLLRSTPDFEMHYYTSISIISPDTFYVAARGQYSLGGTFGFIEKSVNGGTNYTMTTGPGYNSIWFINYLTGWASAYYADDMGYKTDFIYSTTNGGTNWHLQYKDTVNTVSINRIQFVNQNTGYAIGGGYGNSTGFPKFFKTTNGGTNWTKTDIPFYKIFRSLYFINSTTGWICGNWWSTDSATIARTTDGGISFQKQRKTPVNDGVGSVFFLNSITGWAAKGVYILKTTNGGITYIASISGEVPSEYSLMQNYPNPFNSSSKFKFKNSKLEQIKIIVYDINGKKIQTLVNEELRPGCYEVTFDGTGLNSGVYFYQLAAGSYKGTKKMLLIK